MFERIKEDVRSVLDRDPAARNAFEILTCYPGVHALLWHRLCHRLWRWNLRWLARWLSTFSRWMTGIEIHPGARIGRRFFIDHGMGVVIGETAQIGNDVTLYHGVTLGGTSTEGGKRHPTLGSDIVVGAGAKVLGPITVADGARIGSNAVVLKDVPEGATMIGIPARIAGKRPTGHTERREATARKIGFDAYGQTDMPDPVSNAINSMLDHIHATDERLQEMCQAIRHLGGQLKDVELPDLSCCEMENGNVQSTRSAVAESETEDEAQARGG
jgi:serine O-acetyltransferase